MGMRHEGTVQRVSLTGECSNMIDNSILRKCILVNRTNGDPTLYCFLHVACKVYKSEHKFAQALPCLLYTLLVNS